MFRYIAQTVWICTLCVQGLAQIDSAAAYAGADVVITGRLEKIQPSPRGFAAQFLVDQVAKGKLSKGQNFPVNVIAQDQCHAFEENHSYLVYARRIGDDFWIDPSAGSKLLSLAEADLRYIHSLSPKIHEQCDRNRLVALAQKSPIVVKAEVMGTEETMPADNSLDMTLHYRPWCGLVFTTEDAYYKVVDVLKGNLPDSQIVVEHPICWDTITVEAYTPMLSPELFRIGNVLLLFLKPGSHQPQRSIPVPFKSVYEALNENCGAVQEDDEAAQYAIDSLK